MANKVFKGSSIEECVEKASSDLNIPKDRLVYKIIEEKKGFFKKIASISVEITEDVHQKKIEMQNGTVKVQNGNLIVKNPLEHYKPATVIPSKHIKLYIDGEEINSRHEVFEHNKIEFNFNKSEAKRNLNINVTPDRLKVYISISYTPEIIFGLKDTEEDNFIVINVEEKEKKYPPTFSKEEIKEELSKHGIIYGIIEERLEECLGEKGVNDLLIAEGIPAIDDTDDTLQIKFKTCKNPLEDIKDRSDRIDYKNLSSINTVKKDDILAVKVPGKDGKNGKDVYGVTIKKKERKRVNLRIGTGCVLKDENTVVAAVAGKPCMKNNVFYVYELHEVNEDVSLKTGNIQFIGDVKVFGNVNEGMKVKAGNSIDIEKNVESAEIMAKGNITIKGNVRMSTVAAGGEDILILRLISNFKELKATIKNIIEAVMEIKRFNLLGQKATDGEIIKALLENKFKNVSRLCICIIRDTVFEQGQINDETVSVIKQKLVGMAPLAIHHFSELELVEETIEKRISSLEGHLSLPVNVSIHYCQDSTINSSGDVIITGSGEYVSNITAHGGVYFTSEKSVARGGTIQAKNEIKCKAVGSTGGVSTRLSVEARGNIWIGLAFQNTTVAVGTKEFIFEKPAKNVHAYLDKAGELIVDKTYI